MLNPFSPRQFDCSRPQLMGIVNVTPDSFSDGGRFTLVNAALSQALALLDAGACIIDIGGESTRPGATPPDIQEEIQRVVPVIQALRRESDCIISIDTSRVPVMQAALDAGANMINDVRALQMPGALDCAATYDVPICLMHMLGTPLNMHFPDTHTTADIVNVVKTFLQQRIDACVAAGIKRSRLMIDPGFWFGKTYQQNLTLLNHLGELHDLDCLILVGLSRKFEKYLQLNADEHSYISTSLAALAVLKGAHIIRCHEIKAIKTVLTLIEDMH